MMPWQMDRPSPVPMPTGLVVKNGSKMRASRSGAMPVPVSCTSTSTRPGPPPGDEPDGVLVRLALGDGLRRVHHAG